VKNRKVILIISIVLLTIFIAAQFMFNTTINGGACSPYLGAPKELIHPAYQFTTYGFPLPFVTVTTNICLESKSTTYEWSLIGMSINILLLALIAYPIWSPPLRSMK
jgi:hypothetical protein